MAIVSFALTSKQFAMGVKKVTRRDWSERYYQQWLKWWDNGHRTHQGYDRSPRNGGKWIGNFFLTERPYREAISDMPEKDFRLEGVWPEIKTAEQFAKLVGKPVDYPMVVVRFVLLTPTPEQREKIFKHLGIV